MGFGLGCAICGRSWISDQPTEKEALADAKRMIKADPCQCEKEMAGMTRKERRAYFEARGVVF
jgi:hypothetical protein